MKHVTNRNVSISGVSTSKSSPKSTPPSRRQDPSSTPSSAEKSATPTKSPPSSSSRKQKILTDTYSQLSTPSTGKSHSSAKSRNKPQELKACTDESSSAVSSSVAKSRTPTEKRSEKTIVLTEPPKIQTPTKERSEKGKVCSDSSSKLSKKSSAKSSLSKVSKKSSAVPVSSDRPPLIPEKSLSPKSPASPKISKDSSPKAIPTDRATKISKKSSSDKSPSTKLSKKPSEISKKPSSKSVSSDPALQISPKTSERSSAKSKKTKKFKAGKVPKRAKRRIKPGPPRTRSPHPHRCSASIPWYLKLGDKPSQINKTISKPLPPIKSDKSSSDKSRAPPKSPPKSKGPRRKGPRRKGPQIAINEESTKTQTASPLEEADDSSHSLEHAYSLLPTRSKSKVELLVDDISSNSSILPSAVKSKIQQRRLTAYALPPYTPSQAKLSGVSSTKSSFTKENEASFLKSPQPSPNSIGKG